jgi:hypothetical protein
MTDNTGNTAISLLNDGSAEFSAKVETVGAQAAFHVGTDKDSNKTPLNIYDTSTGNTSLARIKGDGSAEFAGGKCNIYADGGIISAALTGKNIAGTSSDADVSVFQAKTYNDVTTVDIKADGSASFARQVVAGGGVQAQYGPIELYAGNPFALQAKIDTDGSAEFKGTIYAEKQFRTQNGYGAADSAVLGVVVEGADGTANASIGYDGTATFGSRVQATITGGQNIYSQMGTNMTVGATAGLQFATYDGGSNLRFYVKDSGAAYFKSNVTSDGTIGFNLEADDDTKYDVTTEEYTETETYQVEVPVLRPEGVVGTADLVDEPKTRTVTKEREVTKTREVRTYNGAVLDVKTELQALRSRATQQDETIRLMTTALKGLGVDVSAFPSPEDEEPTTKSRKKK